MIVQEERRHLQQIKLTYETAWYEVNLGEDYMKDYIKFCQTKKDLPKDFFLSSNRQLRYFIGKCVKNNEKFLRERILNFICSVKLSEDLPTTTLH